MIALVLVIVAAVDDEFLGKSVLRTAPLVLVVVAVAAVVVAAAEFAFLGT